MKTLEFIYQETQIHFLINPTDDNVMINATEMAKLFNRRTDNYLRNETTKTFIESLESDLKNSTKVPHIVGSLDNKIVDLRGRNGIYFCELLALDFATWLDVDFKIWVYKQIRNATLGNYKDHWKAHQLQLDAEKKRNDLENKLRSKPTPEMFIEFMNLGKTITDCKKAKTNAIRNQYKMEFD